MTYRIKDWDRVFESHQERKRITGPLAWVRIPTEGGLAMKRLMRTEGGAEAYGVFVALVRVAARMSVRGVLARSDGSPLSVDDLEDLTEIPATVIRRAIEVLAGDRIGWLIVYRSGESERAENDLERADIGGERADFDLHRAENGNERADTAQISPKMRDRGEEKRKEKMREEETLRATPDEDLDFSPPKANRPPSPKTYFGRLKGLGLWIPRQDQDEEGDREAIVALIECDGIEVVHAACERLRHSGKTRFYLSHVREEIADHAPVAPAASDTEPESPLVAKANAILDRLGFAEVQKIHRMVTDEQGEPFLREILTQQNLGACRELIEAVEKVGAK